MIGIIDYGMGNLRSVENALHHLGKECVISSDPQVLGDCEKWILPGVGAFHDCMTSLKDRNLYDFIQKQVKEEKKPLLGICLGMQMLFESSDENGYDEGFAFLKGHVTKMKDPAIRIPQIGWNELIASQDNPIMKNLSQHPYVYYVHSWFAQDYDEKDLFGYSEYGSLKVPGLVCHENVLGCQFHPEKSSEDGLKILKYFTEEFS